MEKGRLPQMKNEQLVTRIRAGVDVAENMLALYEQMKGLIYIIARRYQAYGELDDLQQEGFLGLYAAVDHYDPERGSFGTCAALWIRQTIVRYLEEHGNAVRIPTGERQRQREYKKFLRTFEQENGRKPEEFEICYYLGSSPESLEGLRRRSGIWNISSLDQPTAAEEQRTISDIVPDTRDAYAELLEEQYQQELKTVIWPLVDALPGDEPKVIRGRYQEEKTLRQLGEELGCCLDNIRQIERRALAELRKPTKICRLRPFGQDDDIKSRGMRGTGTERFNQTWTSATERIILEEEEYEERLMNSLRKVNCQKNPAKPNVQK